MKQEHYIDFQRNLREKVKEKKLDKQSNITWNKHQDNNPVHIAFSITDFGGKAHYCARQSTVLIIYHTMRFIYVSYGEKCIDGDTFLVCRRCEGKNIKLTQDGDKTQLATELL
ncbi:hypothetical protein TNCV_695571 [Trichonephila clavipes]|nr:hypothetical protein TNCV_695571 [Trichonephila clavipes]